MKKLSSSVIISRSQDAYYNLAVEKLLMETCDLPTLFLWQSKNAVIIGAHQNPFAECDGEKMSEDNVQLARRITGGGAVYHDEGNLNFCFITPKNSRDLSLNFQIVLSALEDFGITSKLSGRNDVEVNGFKVSGNAYYRGEKNHLHHGTLLVSSNIEKLSEYLTPSKKKLLKKGVSSVRSRVKNLKEFGKDITVEKLIFALINAFERARGESRQLSPEKILSSQDLATEREFLASDEYLFAKWRNFSKRITADFDWGYCAVNLTVNYQRKIAEIAIESDSLFVQALSDFEKLLKGKSLDDLNKIEPLKNEDNRIFNDLLNLIKDNL